MCKTSPTGQDRKTESKEGGAMSCEDCKDQGCSNCVGDCLDSFKMNGQTIGCELLDGHKGRHGLNTA